MHSFFNNGKAIMFSCTMKVPCEARRVYSKEGKRLVALTALVCLHGHQFIRITPIGARYLSMRIPEYRYISMSALATFTLPSDTLLNAKYSEMGVCYSIESRRRWKILNRFPTVSGAGLPCRLPLQRRLSLSHKHPCS